MILYHFSSFAALKNNNPQLFGGIQAGDSFRWTDDLKPGADSWHNWRDLIVGLERLPPVVWLTSDPNPKRALRAAELRFRLALGSHRPRLVRFEDYFSKVMGSKQVQSFSADPAAKKWEYGWKDWWIHFGAIRCDRIRALEEI